MYHYADIIDGTGSRLSPSSSTHTLDLPLIFDHEFPRILSESPSADTVSTCTDPEDHNIPPCPPRPRMVPSLIALRSFTLTDNSPLPVDQDKPIVVSIPTPLRLSRSLWEPVFIKRWIKTHLDLGIEPHDEVPWAGPKPTKTRVWKPAGSLYHPSDFKRALQATKATNSEVKPLTFGVYAKIMNRERQIIGRPYDRDWVLEDLTSSTSTLSDEQTHKGAPLRSTPQMEEMMAELEGLNVFFREDLDDTEHPLFLHKIKTLPESMSSGIYVEPGCHSSELHPPIYSSESTTLSPAARRGIEDPSAVRIQPNRNTNDLFPSIPSAFSGPPTAGGVQSMSIAGMGDPSLTLNQMVADLRSRCSYTNQSPRNSGESSFESGTSAISFASPSDQVDDDDWGFAATLLDAYSNKSSYIVKVPSSKEDEFPGSQADLNHLHPDPDAIQNLSIPDCSQTGIVDAEPTSISSESSDIPRTPVPSIPLPATPTSTPGSTSSSPRNVRGILKNNKSVRFATLPVNPRSVNTHMCSFLEESPKNASHRLITGPPDLGSQLERPLRVRATSRASRVVPDRIPTRSTRQDQPAGDVYHIQRRDGLPRRPVSISHAAQQMAEPIIQTTELPTSIQPTRRSSVRHSMASGKASTPPSLSHLPKPPEVNKENIKIERSVGTAQKKTNPARWTMSDIAFKRSNGEPQSSGPNSASKSRMPVPLRNILTRFK